VEPGDSIIGIPPSAITGKIGSTRMHPTQPGGCNEHVHQAYIVHNSKIMPEITELDVDEM
jgi:hypothetical protein